MQFKIAKMRIFIRTLAGHTIALKVNPSDTVSELKSKICEQDSSVLQDRAKLLYGGKIIGGRAKLGDCGIRDGSTISVVPKELQERDLETPELQTDDSAGQAQRAWQTKARAFDFDDDLHIVDPQSHFRRINQMWRDVLGSSEYFRRNNSYRTSSTTAEDYRDKATFALDDMVEIPWWLRDKISKAIPKWKASVFLLLNS